MRKPENQRIEMIKKSCLEGNLFREDFVSTLHASSSSQDEAHLSLALVILASDTSERIRLLFLQHLVRSLLPFLRDSLGSLGT